MKHPRLILFTLLLSLVVNTSLANNRLYPANSIHCVNVVWGEKDEHNYDPIEHEYKRHPIYYHYCTGNDTIVDGKPCVMLWKYCADTPKEKELRFLCEEDGIISCKYPLTEGKSLLYLQNLKYVGRNISYTADYTRIGKDIDEGQENGPIIIEGGVHFNIESTYSTTISNSFKCKKGSTLVIK